MLAVRAPDLMVLITSTGNHKFLDAVVSDGRLFFYNDDLLEFSAEVVPPKVKDVSYCV